MGQKSLVFASREPAMRTYTASCIDIACKPLVINQSWLYDRHLNTAMMKETLVEVLNEYPTLAGRISGSSIICNNAGVFWEENQLPGTSVKELSKVTLPEKRFQAEFNNKAAIAGAFPLLSVKVSHLKDGTILNVKCSHFCADGSTFYRMMDNWSSLARDEGFVRKPVYDDTAVSKALSATNVRNAGKGRNVPDKAVSYVSDDVAKAAAYRQASVFAGFCAVFKDCCSQRRLRTVCRTECSIVRNCCGDSETAYGMEREKHQRRAYGRP